MIRLDRPSVAKPGFPMSAKHTVECRKCKHFYITWDKDKPYGCRAMYFKTSRKPSVVVLESSGSICLKFTPKAQSNSSEQ